MLSGTGGFNRCIQSKDVRLEGNVINDLDYLRDILRGNADVFHSSQHFAHLPVADVSHFCGVISQTVGGGGVGCGTGDTGIQLGDGGRQLFDSSGLLRCSFGQQITGSRYVS